MNQIKISLDSDAYEVFKATRMIHCLATNCKHHVMNFDQNSGEAECTLKRIYITEDHTCEQFEEVER